MSGNLVIVASGAVGEQGFRQGVPVTYDWDLRNNLPILYVWIPLVCLLLLPENRTPQACLILVPLAVLSLVLHLILLAAPMDSTGEGLLLQIVLAYAVGLSSIGLLSARLVPRPGGVRIFGIVLVLAAVIGLSCVDSVQPPDHIMMTAIFGTITLFTLLFARSLCKRGFRLRRFFLSFVWGTLIFGAMFSVMWMMLMSVVMGWDFPPVLLLLTFMLIMSGVHMALLTPYLVLMFYNTFWRTRFFGML